MQGDNGGAQRNRNRNRKWAQFTPKRTNGGEEEAGEAAKGEKEGERERERSQQPAQVGVAFNFGAKHPSKLAQLNSTRLESTPLINSTSSLVGINYADVFIVLRFQVW